MSSLDNLVYDTVHSQVFVWVWVLSALLTKYLLQPGVYTQHGTYRVTLGNRIICLKASLSISFSDIPSTHY